MKITKRHGRKVFGEGTPECQSASIAIKDGRSTGLVGFLRVYLGELEIEISRGDIEMLNEKLAFFERSRRP